MVLGGCGQFWLTLGGCGLLVLVNFSWLWEVVGYFDLYSVLKGLGWL